MIWNEKIEFLKKTVNVNPFMSDFFAWIDFGYVRNTRHNGEMMLQDIPQELRTDQVLILDVTSLMGGTKMIGGGFMGGYAAGNTRWHQEYYVVLDKNKDGFIGKEQPMMQVTFDGCPGLCKLIIPDNSQGDPWFYITAYLSGRTTSQQFKRQHVAPEKSDDTRSQGQKSHETHPQHKCKQCLFSITALWHHLPLKTHYCHKQDTSL